MNTRVLKGTIVTVFCYFYCFLGYSSIILILLILLLLLLLLAYSVIPSIVQTHFLRTLINRTCRGFVDGGSLNNNNNPIPVI
jgi:hypothetical protein